MMNLIIDMEEVPGKYAGFVRIEPKSVVITPNMYQTHFNIIIASAIVPPSIRLTFSLISFYEIIHTLSPLKKTLRFELSELGGNLDNPPIKVILDGEEKPEYD